MPISWRYPAYIVLCCMLAGCMASGTRGGRAEAVAHPPRQTLSAEEVPSSIKFATALLINAMRGSNAPLPDKVAFAPQGSHELREATFRYKGFRFLGLDILKYEETSVNQSSAEAGVAGLLHFSDAQGRLANAAFMVKYAVTPKSFTVRQSEVKPLSSLHPRLLCFYIPLEAYKQAVGQLHSFEQWLQFAAKQAISLTPTPADRARRVQWAQLPEADKDAWADRTYPLQRYAVVLISLDRVLPPGVLQMGLMEDGGGLLHTELAKFHNYDGWSVAVMADVELALDHPRNTMYVCMNYTPDQRLLQPGAPPTYSVGIFAMQKNY